MKNPFKKISKKTVLIASTLVVLIAIPVSIYFLTRDQGDVKSWYSSSWMYRRAITVSNSVSTLTNEDVLITIDTATLVSAGKLQADCDDLRFLDSDDSTLLSYWIEAGCNTSATEVWIRIPTLTAGNYTVYVYYGNSSATSAQASWTGNFLLLADAACPSGWTQDTSYNGSFPYGATSSIGSTGGSESHTHTSSIDTATNSSSLDYWSGNSAISGSPAPLVPHQHTVSVPLSSTSTLPAYLNMIFCSNQSLDLKVGMITGFNVTMLPSGWTRFSALDNRFVRGNSTYGGGNSTDASHTHSTGTVSVSSDIKSSSLYLRSGTGNDVPTSHSHTASGISVSSTTSTPPYYTLNYAKTTSASAGKEYMATMATALPPLGWETLSPMTGLLPRGSSMPGTTGGASTHIHTVSGTIGNAGVYAIYKTVAQRSVFVPIGAHNHGTFSGDSNTSSNLPPYIRTIFTYRKSSLGVTLLPEQRDNLAPTAPTALLTEGATNPTGVTDLTPEFSAIYNDPDTGDTALFYEIEVNTNNTFTGTVMWDSNKTAMSAVANGIRIADKSYAGTTLSTNGATYYWRIRLWDNNDTVSPWSATAQFTMNNTPTAPTALLTEGATNPLKVTDLTPEFSAIFNDPDTGATALYYEIEVNTTSAFNGTVMWDSNKTSMSAVAKGARIADKSYAGTALSANGATYYWRIRLWDENDTVSPWSATAQFTMSTIPNAPTELTVDGYLTPSYQIFSLYPNFTAKHTHLGGSSAIFYEIEINTNSAFNGTVMWDTGKQSMTSTPNNSVCPNITYAGTMLSNSSNTYFWRIRFWDTDDTVSPWSAVGSFVDHLTNIQLEGLGLEGLGIN